MIPMPKGNWITLEAVNNDLFGPSRTRTNLLISESDHTLVGPNAAIQTSFLDFFEGAVNGIDGLRGAKLIINSCRR